MTWRVSPILAPLIAEVRAANPGMVIGTIGDPAHQAEVSDHNPDQWGYVAAADFMIGASFTAADAERLFDRIHALRDGRTAFVIYNRMIVSRTVSAWSVRTYRGDDPHTNHVHVSVVHGSNPHPTTAWNIYPKPEDNVTPADIDAIAEAVKDKILLSKLGNSSVTVAQALQNTEYQTRGLTATLAEIVAATADDDDTV